ncbi:hypothetical protein ACLB2K_066174 [Fragaria x ananassa]
MQAQDDLFILDFSKVHGGSNMAARRRSMVLWGSFFVMVEYDGLRDAASMSIKSFPIWIKILSLPPTLWTDEATEKVENTLGFVE